MTFEFESTINTAEEEDVPVLVKAWWNAADYAPPEVYEVARADTGQDVIGAMERYVMDRLEREAMGECPAEH